MKLPSYRIKINTDFYFNFDAFGNSLSFPLRLKLKGTYRCSDSKHSTKQKVIFFFMFMTTEYLRSLLNNRRHFWSSCWGITFCAHLTIHAIATPDHVHLNVSHVHIRIEWADRVKNCRDKFLFFLSSVLEVCWCMKVITVASFVYIEWTRDTVQQNTRRQFFPFVGVWCMHPLLIAQYSALCFLAFFLIRVLYPTPISLTRCQEDYSRL